MGRKWTGFRRQLQAQLIDFDLRVSDLKSAKFARTFYEAATCPVALTAQKYSKLDDSVFMVCRSCGNCSQAPVDPTTQLPTPTTQTEPDSAQSERERACESKMTTLNNSTSGGDATEGATVATGAPATPAVRIQLRSPRRQRRNPLSNTTNTSSTNSKQFLTWSASAANHKLQKLSKNLVSSVARLQTKMDKVKFPFNNGSGGAQEVRRTRSSAFPDYPAAGYLNGLIENTYTCGPEEFNNNNQLQMQLHKDKGNIVQVQNGIPGTSDNVVSLAAVVQNLRKRNNHATSNTNNLNSNSRTTNSSTKNNTNADNSNVNRNINDNSISSLSSSPSSSSSSSSSSCYPKLSTVQNANNDEENNFNMLEMRPITAAISKQLKSNEDINKNCLSAARDAAAEAEDDEFGFSKGNRSQGSDKMYKTFNYNASSRTGAPGGSITNRNSASNQSVSSTTPLLQREPPGPPEPPPLPLTPSPASVVLNSKLSDTIFEEEGELRTAAWFQGGIPREIALDVLRHESVGSFIVRESTTKSGCLALSLRVPRQFHEHGIAHYLILKTGKGYKIKGFTKEFGSLTSLITHHSVMPELLPCPLSLHSYRTKCYSKKTSGRFNTTDFVEPEKLISFTSAPLATPRSQFCTEF